jgi:hypothetical protein
MIAGLAIVALALGSPVFANCVAPVVFGSGFYVARGDVADSQNFELGPLPSLSSSMVGSFWSLGLGNPAGVGMDNGSLPALGYWLQYGGTNAGEYYPYYILGTWVSAAVDGCPDLLPNPCMYLLVNDTDGAGKGYFALAAVNADNVDNYDFNPLGNIRLAELPTPKIVGSTRISASEVQVDVSLSQVPNDAASGLYLNCGGGPTGFKLYRQKVPRNGTPSSNRDLSGPEWAPVGPASTPAAGTANDVSITCVGDEDIYLAAALTFDSGFQVALLSENGTGVQCGPTLVDPVKPITPPRRGKPTSSVGPRDDRGSRR